MATTEAQKQASYKYHKKSIKRVPLDMQKADYKRLAAAAGAVGEKVNGYIKKAIEERMEREGK